MKWRFPSTIILVMLLSGCIGSITPEDPRHLEIQTIRPYKLLIDSEASSIELQFYQVGNRLPPQIAIDAMILNLNKIVPDKEVSVPDPIKITVSDESATREWSFDDLYSLVKSYPRIEREDKFVFQIFILNGFMNQTTGLYVFESIFIFPDIFLGQEVVFRFVTVHEMGHAIGLVNAGIPMIKYRLASKEDDPCQCHSTQKNSPVRTHTGYISLEIFDNNQYPYLFNDDDLNDIKSFIEAYS